MQVRLARAEVNLSLAEDSLTNRVEMFVAEHAIWIFDRVGSTASKGFVKSFTDLTQVLPVIQDMVSTAGSDLDLASELHLTTDGIGPDLEVTFPLPE